MELKDSWKKLYIIREFSIYLILLAVSLRLHTKYVAEAYTAIHILATIILFPLVLKVEDNIDGDDAFDLKSLIFLLLLETSLVWVVKLYSPIIYGATLLLFYYIGYYIYRHSIIISDKLTIKGDKINVE
mgnify:CR=1 FL=1